MSQDWVRVVGENGTIYCAWLFNAHNCFKDNDLAPILLASGIISLIIFAFTIVLLFKIIVLKRNSLFIFWKPVGFIATYILLNGVHALSVFGNGYWGSPYGFLLFYFGVCFGLMGAMAFLNSIMKASSDVSSCYDEALHLQSRKRHFFVATISFILNLINNCVCCYLLDAGSPAADPFFKYTFCCFGVSVVILTGVLLHTAYNFFIIVRKSGIQSTKVKVQVKRTASYTTFALSLLSFVGVEAGLLGFSDELFKNFVYSEAMLVITYIVPIVAILCLLVTISSWELLARDQTKLDSSTFPTSTVQNTTTQGTTPEQL